MPILSYIFTTIICLCCASLALADKPKAELCPPHYSQPKESITPLTPNDMRTHIVADQATVTSEDVTTFKGNVQAQKSNRLLSADEMIYQRQTEDFEANGNISLYTPQIKITGDSARVNLTTNQGIVNNTHYYTNSVNGRGSADNIVILDDQHYELNNANYTTCPPGDEAWNLHTSTLFIDQEKKQGSANHVILDVANIPIFYFPYLRFPLGNQRMSGFLFPTIAVSDELGTELTIPYYWNIAPDMDATITPHNMTRRGLMLETEFRYLAKNSSGTIQYDYLSNDKIFGDDREKLNWQHSASPGEGWSSSVKYNYVSDKNYIDDFSSSLNNSSVTHLERQGQLNYNQTHFVVSALVQDYQNLTGGEPYKRLPQLKFNTRFTNQDNRLNYDIDTEYVNFDHRDNSRLIGQRLKLSPYVSYPIQADAGFLIPKVTLHHLAYELDQLPSSDQEDSPGVTVPVFSLDTGLFLERDAYFGDTALLHTLEPRLFYLYAPNKDQSDLPAFDTGLTTFGQSLLFSENRFSGNDRIGDANRLTTALTTRFYRQDTGKEVFNATLGQINYFRDRNVTLPSGSIQTNERSSYLGAISLTPNDHFKITNELQFDSEAEHTEVSNSRIQYKADNGKIINYEYRFRRNEIRTHGLSFAWRLNPSWQFFGGREVDLENNHLLENFFGFHYEDCCWGVRIVGTEKFDKLINNNEPRFEHAIYLEIELKGLSSLGSGKSINTVLEDGILDYSN